MNNIYSINPMLKQKFKKIIKAANLNQKQLANKLGITHETVSRHVNGSTAISNEDAVRYAEILGMPPEFFLFDPPGIDILGTVQPDSTIKKNDVESSIPKAVAPFSFPFNSIAIQDLHYDEPKNSYRSNRLFVFNKKPMLTKSIGDHAIDNLSVFSAWDKNVCQIFIGKLLLEDVNQNTYSLECIFSKKNNKNNLKINWASPIINTYYQPSLQGIEIIYN